ncbi:MAG TPA: response regulator [Noviherbaspirillum sp.]
MSSEFHFLVVDDMPLMRHVATISLHALGYTKISEAANGEQALRLLCSSPASGTQINFIITDWCMPIMDGMALLRTVRARSELKHLPVLMVSAQAEEEERAIAAQAGTDGYIVKPLNPENLKAALDSILTKRG